MIEFKHSGLKHQTRCSLIGCLPVKGISEYRSIQGTGAVHPELVGSASFRDQLQPCYFPSVEVLRIMWDHFWLDGHTLTCVRKRTVAGICSSFVCIGQYVKFLKWVLPLKMYGQFKVDTVIILLL